MLTKLFQRPVKEDFAIIDPVFPQAEPYAFRNTEINEYFKRIQNCASYTMPPMKPGPNAWFEHGYGVGYRDYLINKKGYGSHYPENIDRIHYLHDNKKYRFKMAYSFFLAETYTLLPFYEKHKIPFVFCLYPGGAFGLDNDKSDAMLREIFENDNFKGVIVTQQITKDYLLEKYLCPPSKINFIYGGFVQFEKAEVKPKKYFQKDKQTFDICFVAAKYSEKGIDKGYDLFIETAKKLCKVTEDIMFHVVGGFTKEDIDISAIESRIKFYGYRRPDFLLDFYSSMDIFLGPGRPYKLFKGNFDGFPLGIDAGFCGTALFVSDELRMNKYYKENEEIVIVPLDSNRIKDVVLHHYRNLENFYELAINGQKRTQHLFDINQQIEERLEVFRQFVQLNPTDHFETVGA